MLIITFTSNDQIQRPNHFATNYKLRNIFFFLIPRKHLPDGTMLAGISYRAPAHHCSISSSPVQSNSTQTDSQRPGDPLCHKTCPAPCLFVWHTRKLRSLWSWCNYTGARVGMPPAGFQAFRVGICPRLSPLEKRIERGQATNNPESETSLLGPRNTQWHA